MHVHKGSAMHARAYVEADRHRCGDYYLADGEGVAERIVASRDGEVLSAGPLDGDQYERWVAGLDPATGLPNGRLRADEHANRFQEVTINGPKSWSLVAALIPEVAAAYDAAQARAATQVVGWLGAQLTYRVGGRGEQVQMPVDQIEAVMVRHHTSRAGDPHRHIHLQVNARVWGDGAWRGLHTVGFRDSLAAMNGIGHAAMMSDPDSGALWRGGASRSTWQLRRSSSSRPTSARSLPVPRRSPATSRGTRLPGARTIPAPSRRPSCADNGTPWRGPTGAHRRSSQTTLPSRRRSGCGTSANIRGQVERLLAEINIVTAPSIRAELAEDITSRAIAKCVSLVDSVDPQSHVRHLTSPHVVAVENELAKRLAARSHAPSREDHEVCVIVDATTRRYSPDLDAGQLQAVGAIVAGPQLVVIEGAAGAGKTTLLVAAHEAHRREYRQLTVVTPTGKAARVAAEQTGAAATSAAWLAHQHGYRWDENGRRTRLQPGHTDLVTGRVYEGRSREAMLRPRGTLLIDEAGMLDQDTALALLTIADESRVRVAFVGDRHQLPAVGRGGVLDHAVRWVDPNGYVPLEAVHRFRDPDYADLTLKMRNGEQPVQVFDQLATDGHVAMHADQHQRTNAIVTAVVESLAAGRGVIVAADTRAQVLELNLAIRGALIRAGVVDGYDEVLVPGGSIGAGDKIVTRRNDTDLAVANRDSWTVTQVHEDQSVTVVGKQGQRHLPATYVQQHVELGYATTVHGPQGDTVDHAHLVLSDTTGAAAAYVGMTRGRQSNTAHIVADSLPNAREQWTATFGRDRADLGPAAAAKRAYEEAARNAALHRVP